MQLTMLNIINVNEKKQTGKIGALSELFALQAL